MATISLANMLQRAEQAAYSINAEAKRLSSVQAEIPKVAPPPVEKKEETLRTTPTDGKATLDGEVGEVEKTNEEIEKDKIDILSLLKNPQAMRTAAERGIRLVDILDLSEALVGRSVLDNIG